MLTNSTNFYAYSMLYVGIRSDVIQMMCSIVFMYVDSYICAFLQIIFGHAYDGVEFDFEGSATKSFARMNTSFDAKVQMLCNIVLKL